MAPNTTGNMQEALNTSQEGAGGGDYYAKGSAEAATESALTLQKIQHRLRLTKKADRLVIVLVGLPGRGKSFIARKLSNFITWRGSDCKVFNVGRYRRLAADGACDADFFDSKNSAAAELRQKAARLALEDMLQWLDNEDGSGAATPTSPTSVRKDRVGIFDATNSTKERRDWVLKECTCRIKRAGKPTGVVFVESICDDKDLLHANYMTKVKNSPDYRDMDIDVAMADLLSRTKKYEEAYETIEDDEISYIKIFNLSSKMLVNHIYGRMAKSIVPALMSWNIGTRPVFVCRAGQTMNEAERATLNCAMSQSENLGKQGRAFRDALFSYMRVECLEFINRRHNAAFSPDLNTGTSISGLVNRGFTSHTNLAALDSQHTEVEVDYVGSDGVTPLPFPCHIVSSTMPRARQTVDWEGMPYPVEMLSNLNPLDKGDFTGKELEDLAVKHPEWYNQLVADPFYTRFPGGECYGDLTSRLESVVVDIEQQVGPVLVVSHVSVLQVLVAYFRNQPIETCTSIALPLNTVLKFTPAKGGGWKETQHLVLHSPSNSHTDLNSMDNGMYCHAPAQTSGHTFITRVLSMSTASSSRTSVTERSYTCSDGVKLAARHWTNIAADDARPTTTRRILCLHGWLDNAASFNRLAPLLLDSSSPPTELVALDFPGHGLSGHKSVDGPPQLLAEYAYYVAELVEALDWGNKGGGSVGVSRTVVGNINSINGSAKKAMPQDNADTSDGSDTNKIILCGHSMGSGVATVLCAAFPEWFSSLILLEGGLVARNARDAGKHVRAACQRRLKSNRTLFPNGSSNESADGEVPLPRAKVYSNLESAIEARLSTTQRMPGDQFLSYEAARDLVLRATAPAPSSLASENSEAIVFRHDPRLQWPSLQYYTREQVEAFFHDVHESKIPVCFLYAADGWPVDSWAEGAVREILRPGTLQRLSGSHHFHADPDSVPAVAREINAWLDRME
ncbi:hypothetical protein ACHAXT_012192 [Thalassiosira profunda]